MDRLLPRSGLAWLAGTAIRRSSDEAKNGDHRGALLVDNADRGRLLRHVQPDIMRHRNLRWCKAPGNMPGSRHYRLLGFAPRLPEVHIWRMPVNMVYRDSCCQRGTQTNRPSVPPLG